MNGVHYDEPRYRESGACGRLGADGPMSAAIFAAAAADRRALAHDAASR